MQPNNALDAESRSTVTILRQEQNTEHRVFGNVRSRGL